MRQIRLFGIAGLLIGLALIFTAHYIYGEVAAGRQRIAEGQAQVDASNQFFSLTPLTEILGDGFTSGAQAEIDSGRATADSYAKLAGWLDLFGIIALLGGSGMIAYSLWKKKVCKPKSDRCS